MEKFIILLTIVPITGAPVMAKINASVTVKDIKGNRHLTF